MDSFIPFFFMFCMLSETVDSVSVSADIPSPINGDQVKLTCSITGFSVSAFWINNATSAVLTTCFPGGFCLPASLGNYSFSANASAIVVQISSFALSDDFGWKCQHSVNTAVFKFVFITTSTPSSSTPCQSVLGFALGLSLCIQCVIICIVFVIFKCTGYKYAYTLGLVLGLSLAVTFIGGCIIIASLIYTGTTTCKLELGLGLGLGSGMPCVITIIIAVIFVFFSFFLFEGIPNRVELGKGMLTGLLSATVIGIIVYLIYVKHKPEQTGYKHAYFLGLVHGVGIGVTFQVGWIIIVILISTGNKYKLELGLGLGLGSGMPCVITGIIAVIFVFSSSLFKGIPKRVKIGRGILTGLLFASVIGIIVVYLRHHKRKGKLTSIKHEDNPPKQDGTKHEDNPPKSDGKKHEQVPLQPADKKGKTKNPGPPAVHTGTQNKVEPDSNQTNDRQQPPRPQPQPPQNGETPRPKKLPPLTAKQETVQEVDASEESKKKRKKKKKKDQVNENTPEEANGETDLRDK